MVSAVLPPATPARVLAAGDFAEYSTSNSAFATKVDFVVACTVAHVLRDDPIVFPGQPGSSHSHTFGGNESTDAFSTPLSLARQQTNCKMSRDRAAYWMPTLYSGGKMVTPYAVRAYYRAATFKPSSVRAIPFGLRMIAGDPMATTPQSASIAGFQCRNTSGNSVPKQATPPRCPTGDFLEASVVFPNCWDGVHVDSADHRSHMAYADPTAPCPAAHPVRLPQLTIAQRYPVNSTRNVITLAHMTGMSAGALTLHADYLDAWDPATMQALVAHCILKGVACEDVGDKRLPPGMTLPRDTTPSSMVGGPSVG